MSYERCPKCGKKGWHAPRRWFGGPIPEGTWPRMCRYCTHTEFVKGKVLVR